MAADSNSDNALKSRIGARMKELILKGGDTIAHVARENDIPRSTMDSWLGGVHYPDMKFMIHLARRYGVTLDWILTGQESLLPKDGRERDLIIHYRDLKEHGVADAVDEFMDHQLQKSHSAAEEIDRNSRKRAAKAFGLDTFGKRLRYLRETERWEESVKEFAAKLDLTEQDYLALEEDRKLPGTRTLTALTGLLMDPVTKDQSIIDWLLEGE